MAALPTTISQSDNLLHQLLLKQPSFKPSGTKTFLYEIAERIRRNEDEIISVALVGFSLETKLRERLIRLLEFRSFYLKLWLRRIKLISDEDNEKYTSLQDFEQTILSAHEATKEYKYSIYKEYYKEEKLQKKCLEQKKLLENALRKVWEKKERSSFEMTEEDFIRFESHTARLCSILGLKLDFLDYLDEMPKEHTNHRKLSEWIEIILEDNSKSLLTADKNTLTEKLLESLGFDPLSTAVESIMRRSSHGSTQQHIEACEWAQMFIKDEFKYNPLLSTLTAKFLFPSLLPNTWVELPNVSDEEIESNINLSNVYIMKLVTEEAKACSKTWSVFNGFVPHDEQNIVLYHGTDHESAHQILFRGIYLCAGRQKRDFSCGKGFYLTDKMEDALNWAKSTTARPAMLIFVVNRKELDKARKLNLTLNENKEKWKEIVSSFRTAKRTAITQDSLCSFDLVEGPTATVTRNQTSDELVFEPKPSSYQICLISDNFAEKFEQTLHSIVFFGIS